MENWSKVIVLKVKPPISKVVFKDIVSLDWGDLSKDDIIIVLLLELIRKSIVSLVDLNKFLVSNLIIRVIFGMIFNCELPVGTLDIIKSCRCWNPEGSVIVAERTWIVLVKEFFF
jgi:hypothetical protein